MANPFEKKSDDLCPGCLSGNIFQCRSFPGSAKVHTAKEKAYQKSKGKHRRQVRAPPQERVYRRPSEE